MEANHLKLLVVGAASIFGSFAFLSTLDGASAQVAMKGDSTHVVEKIAGYRSWKQIHNPIDAKTLKVTEGSVLSVLSPDSIAV